MSKERLEEVKEDSLEGRHSFLGTPWVSMPKENHDWLIQQAEEKIQLEERVKELKQEIDGMTYHEEYRDNEYEKLYAENQRYKQALIEGLEIAKGNVLSSPACSDIEVILSQTLQGGNTDD